MAYKSVGVDDTTSLFPPRVMTALRKLFPSTSAMSNVSRKNGSIIGWCGDSHTVGSGTSNAFYSFRVKTTDIAGGFVVSQANSINGGVAGERTDQLLARIPAIIAAGAQTLFVLIGTNDASQFIAVSQFATNMQAIKALADQAGVGFIVSTIPPRSSSTNSDTLLKTNGYNMWLKTWAATNAIPIVDIWSATVNTATGYLRSDLDSGDGTHLNDAGHAIMANAIASVMKKVIQSPVWPITSAGLGLTNDPLATDPNQFQSTRWDIVAGYYPELSVSLVTASSFSLPAGNWIRFSHANVSGATRYSQFKKLVDLTKCNGGDKLLFLMNIRGSEVGAINKVEVRDATTSLGVVLDNVQNSAPGPVAFSYTLPATKPSELSLSFTIAAPTGRTSYVDIGAADVLNLNSLAVSFNGL